MDKKWKNLIGAVFFAAGLVGILLILSRIITPANKAIYDTVSLDEKKGYFDEERENSLDVMFFGDSEAYAVFFPYLMYKENGFTSYVMGTSAQRLCDTYELVRYSLETQSPKAIVFETNNFYSQAGNGLDDDVNLVQKALPVFRYHSRWKTIFMRRMNKWNDASAEGQQKGFRFRNKIEPYKNGEYMFPTTDVKEMSELAQYYLDQTLDLCKEKNIPVAFISVPSAVCWNYEQHNYVEQLAKEKGIPFLDMNLLSEVNIDWTKETKDGGNHLNYEGACKASKYVGKYLKKLFELPDHRDEDEYSDWDELCDEFFSSDNKHVDFDLDD